ncbi:MAG: NB-ARC domain-containing protein [Alphaproteobacteria bacterium]
MGYDFDRPGATEFQNLVQALLAAVAGPTLRVTGSGPDGGRDAVGQDVFRVEDAPSLPGITVFQVKHRERPSEKPALNGTWLINQIRAELKLYCAGGRPVVPDNYVVITNVALTMVAETGSWDRLDKVIAKFRPRLPPNGFQRVLVWDRTYLERRLDAFPDIAKTYAHLITPGVVLGTALPTIERISEIVQLTKDVLKQRLETEGKTRFTDWFAHWPGDDRPPLPIAPPVAGFVTETYVERAIETAIIDRLKRGEAAGITGLVGMGGIGKTHMALKITTDFRQEGWEVAWLGLLKIDQDQALDALAESFELRFLPGLVREEKEAALASLMQAHRRARTRLMIVLDNAERFAGLESLLRLCRGFPVLVTSRTAEVQDVVHYRRLDQMDADQAAALCRNFLNERIAGLYDDVLNAQEREELTGLCADLGGHPLGIRLALSAILPSLRRPLRSPSALADFRSDLRQRPIVLLRSATDTREDELHRSIQQTFDWLFHDLPARSPDGVGVEAQLLLPLVAQLAVVPLSLGGLGVAIDALVETVNDAMRGQSADAPPWIADLARLRDPAVRQQALEALHEVSLLTLVDEPDREIRVHPLVREYAFHDRQQASASALDTGGAAGSMITPSGPSDMAIITAVLRGSKTLRSRGDILFGLQSRTIVKALMRDVWMAIEDQAGIYYFIDRQWARMDSLLMGYLPYAQEAGDDYIQGSILCEVGELRLRMEDPNGLDDVRAGIALLDKCSDDEAHRRAAWGRSIVLGYNDPSSSRPDIEARVENLRRLMGDERTAKRHALISAVHGDVAGYVDERIDFFSAEQLSLRNTFLSNIAWTLNDIVGKPHHMDQGELARIQSLLESARRRHEEAALQDPNARLSVEAESALQSELLLRQAEDGSLSVSDADAAFAGLAYRLRQAGIRGFSIESSHQRAVWRIAMRCRDWPRATDHATAWLKAAARINTHAPYTTTILPRTCLQLSRALTADADGLAGVTAEVDVLEAEARRYFDNRILGWLLLVRAVIAARHGGDVRTTVGLALASRRAFARFGPVPPTAERVFRHVVDLVDDPDPRFEATRDALAGNDQDAAPPDFQPWNLARAHPLPRLVTCKRDGRTMRLVERGWQPGPWSGEEARDISLYPFYVDEMPVTVADLRRLGFDDLLPTQHLPAAADAPVRLTLDQCQDFARRVRKRLPIHLEWTAMVWQQQAGGTPLHWQDRQAARQAILDRIERAITGDVSPQLTWPEGQDTTRPAPSAWLKSHKNDWDGFIDYWCGERWIDDHPVIQSLLTEQLEPVLRAKAPGVPDEDLRSLAVALINTVSLGAANMVRLLETEGTFSLVQVTQMIALLADEREALAACSREETDGVVARIDWRVRRNHVLGRSRVMVSAAGSRGARSEALWTQPVGFWIDAVNPNGGAARWAPATAVFDQTIGLVPDIPVEFNKGQATDGHFLRLVIPLFFATDLDGLEKSDGPGKQPG